MIGLEIDTTKTTTGEICDNLLKKGVLSKDTHGTVVRFSPPLVIEKSELDWAIDRVADTLREMG